MGGVVAVPRRPDTPCNGCGKLIWRGKGCLPPGQARCRECRRACPAPYGPRPGAPSRERTCEHCGATYQARWLNKPQRFCTPACRTRASRRTPLSRPCKRCGTEFAIDAKNSRRTYCSATCAVEASRKARSCRIYIVDCGECGRPFVARPQHKKMCSAECRKARQARRYHDNPKYRNDIIASNHARRANKLGLGDHRITLAYLIERDKGRCQMPVCQFRSRKVAALGAGKRNPRGPSIDHIIPLSRGGTHTLDNVQLAHLKCNRVKHNTGAGDQLLLIG